MQALQTGLWSKSGPLATRARNPWRGHLQNRHGREYPISDQRGKVLSFGPFELSIGNRLLANGAKVVPLGARAMSSHRPCGASKRGRRQENPDRARLAKERGRTSQSARPHLSATEGSRSERPWQAIYRERARAAGSASSYRYPSPRRRGWPGCVGLIPRPRLLNTTMAPPALARSI